MVYDVITHLLLLALVYRIPFVLCAGLTHIIDIPFEEFSNPNRYCNAKVIPGLHNFFVLLCTVLTYIYRPRNLVTQTETAMVMLGSIAKRKCCDDFFSLHFTLHEVEPNKIQP
jgi:hypothetical protein